MEWNSDIEKILNEYKQKCCGYKWMYERKVNKYKLRDKILGVLSILLVTISAVSNTYLESNKSNETKFTDVFFNVILYISAALKSIQSFLGYSSLVEQDKTSAKGYNALYNYISRMLALDVNHRQNATDFFNWVTKEYDNLFASSSELDDDIISMYEKAFGKIIEISELKTVKMSSIISEPEPDHIKYELERFLINSYN